MSLFKMNLDYWHFFCEKFIKGHKLYANRDYCLRRNIPFVDQKDYYFLRDSRDHKTYSFDV